MDITTEGLEPQVYDNVIDFMDSEITNYDN